MANEPGKAPRPLGPMLLHAVLAAGFFFGLNRFVLDQPLETALLWGVVAAPFAAYMAYAQTRK
jgi:hypothetical protein